MLILVLCPVVHGTGEFTDIPQTSGNVYYLCGITVLPERLTKILETRKAIVGLLYSSAAILVSLLSPIISCNFEHFGSPVLGTACVIVYKKNSKCCFAQYCCPYMPHYS